MDEQALKKIVKDVVNEAIEPLKQDLNVVKQDLNGVKQDLASLKDITENRILPSVTETEVILKSYADSYKINQHNIERVDTRLTTVEENLNIAVPEDSKVPHFASK